MVLAAVRVGGEVLAAVLNPAYRMAQADREPAKADLLGQQNPLVPEAAADIGSDHPDLPVVEPKAFG